MFWKILVGESELHTFLAMTPGFRGLSEHCFMVPERTASDPLRTINQEVSSGAVHPSPVHS